MKSAPSAEPRHDEARPAAPATAGLGASVKAAILAEDRKSVV